MAAKFGGLKDTRIEAHSTALVDCIKRELADAASFTRDDLLYLSVFDSVATITRYRYVCSAVQYALSRRWLLEINRSELCLYGGKNRYKEHIGFQADYNELVLEGIPHDRAFRVSDILRWWLPIDHHISPGTKRTIIRVALKHYVHKGVIEELSFGEYQRVRKS